MRAVQSLVHSVGDRQAEAGLALDAAHGVDEVGLGEVDEAGHQVSGAVAFADLGEPASDGDGFAVGCGGHVAVGQCVAECLVGGWELAGERIGEAAFSGFDDCAGVPGDEAADDVVGVGDVAEVAGSVKRVKAGGGDLGAVADVVQPGRGFEEVGVVAEDGGKGASLPGDTLGVCPAAWERLFEQFTGDLPCPCGRRVHVYDAMAGRWDVHGRDGASYGRLGGMERFQGSHSHVLLVRGPFAASENSQARYGRVDIVRP